MLNKYKQRPVNKLMFTSLILQSGAMMIHLLITFTSSVLHTVADTEAIWISYHISASCVLFQIKRNTISIHLLDVVKTDVQIILLRCVKHLWSVGVKKD